MAEGGDALWFAVEIVDVDGSEAEGSLEEGGFGEGVLGHGVDGGGGVAEAGEEDGDDCWNGD